ncbi:enoyl-CoA hydratase/isomerase family protein [Burkholderia multivorans]|nr:enoyl-CoA hydratase/isomerase family protein [Burkholderia multivorans]
MQEVASEVVLCEVRDSVAWLTINRPDKLNALSSTVVITMREWVRKLNEDDSVSVIVIKGAGKAFSVGYDIAEEVAAGIERPEDWHVAFDLPPSIGPMGF